MADTKEEFTLDSYAKEAKKTEVKPAKANNSGKDKKSLDKTKKISKKQGKPTNGKQTSG